MQQMQPVKPAPTVPDMAQFTDKLNELISKIDHQPVGTTQQGVNDVTEYTPDDDALRAVHAKALKRMTKDSSGQIEAKQTIGQSDASSRADELGDLLK